MAEEFGSKTEAATPRHREKAREEGQVAFSAELVTGVIVLAGIALLSLGARRLGGGLLAEARLGILAASRSEFTVSDGQALLGNSFTRCLDLTSPYLAVLFIGGLAASLVQVGFFPNIGLVAFKWERITPFAGSGQLFSSKNAVRGMFAMVRLAVIGVVAWWVLSRQFPRISMLGATLASAVTHGWAIVLQLTLAIAGGMLLLGVADYLFQRWRHEQSLRMSREELKEETKREDGDPQTKARVRRLQRDAARKKMFHEVKTATLVVTNPTHLAIALRYDRGSMGAPRVVAKGAGYVALRIAELARRHGVPVMERKSLAQALFRTVKLNQEIPMAMYQAVAAVLAAVYRARGHVFGSRPDTAR